MKHGFVHRGFTLVEVLLSVVLIALLVLTLSSMTNATASTWRYTSGKIEQFRGATTAFETITRRLSQATLNTSWDYHYPNDDTSLAPDSYVRQSDLRFLSGRTETLMGTTAPRRPTHGIFFQAPLGFVDDTVNFGGLDNLLNTWGYYIEINKDTRPAFLDTLPNSPPVRTRSRLMELMQPANKITIYSKTSGNSAYVGHEWFTDAFVQPNPPVHVLAENIIAMVLLPKLSKVEDPTGSKLTPTYEYDSTRDITSGDPMADPGLNPKNQLPPVVQITLVAIDETSANRLSATESANLTTELDGLFTQAKQFETDLRKDPNGSNPGSLESYLINQKIGYRIFTANVSLRGAKWSRK